MNTITIELCGEDRARLDRILAALEGLNKPIEVREAVTAVAEAVEEVAMLTPEPAQPKTTLADVQAMVQKLATPASGKRADVKRIVNEYAPRVSDIPEDKLDEVKQRLTELGGENA